MELLDGVKTMLELSEGIGRVTQKTMKNLRLVNRHWSLWATNATTVLRAPGNGIAVRELVELVAQKFCNLKSLRLDKVPLITDDDVRIVCMLPSLTHVDLSQIGILCYRQITDIGMSSLTRVTALSDLNLGGSCTEMTDMGMRHLAALKSLTKFLCEFLQ